MNSLPADAFPALSRHAVYTARWFCGRVGAMPAPFNGRAQAIGNRPLLGMIFTARAPNR